MEQREKLPDNQAVYEVLVSWAKAGEAGTYERLSYDYERVKGVRFHWFGTWDDPLGAINNIVARWKAPPISALVVLKGSNEPGRGFWACADNVPKRPRSTMKRIEVTIELQHAVHAYDWPATLDGL